MNENEMNPGNTRHGCGVWNGLWSILPEAIAKRQYEYQAYLLDSPSDYQAYIEAQGPFEVDVNTAPSTFWVDDDIAVMRIEGVIEPKGNILSALFGGVAALDVLTRDFKFLLASDDINAIVLDIDSPGGSVSGMFSFSNMIFEARKTKSIFAFSDATMTSAAGLIGAAAGKGNTIIADEAVVTGSIAVRTEHTDISELEKKFGIKTTEIASGIFKTITTSHAPLSKEGRAILLAQVSHIDSALLEAIAMYRETTVEDVRENMAQGKIFLGSQGVKAGLIDAIMPQDEFMKAVKAELLSANFNKN